MSPVTPKNFLNLLGQSGLVKISAVKESLAELSREAAGKPVSLDQLASHLVKAGLITEWHSSKLKIGKYKGFFLGKYKLLRMIGSGGMSTVYLAQHTIFDQLRAIKVLPKNKLANRTYLDRFYREGRAAASLNHRNIVRVYDIANEGDTHYLVMEYFEGQDIYEMVKQKGPLGITATIDYTIQALTGLSHAHENDLVHRDVKPANLLVTLEGTVKLLDLGLALFREEDTSLTVMHNEKVLGTADYLSPEQAIDSHSVDLRSDIYSTGCTMYYMLSGRPPFNDGTLAQRIARHQTIEPVPVQKLRPDCPDKLAAIVKKMMQKNPADRYQACEPLIAELRQLLEEVSVSSKAAQVKTESTVPVSAPQKALPTPVSARKEPAKTTSVLATKQFPANGESNPNGNNGALNKPTSSTVPVGPRKGAAPQMKSGNGPEAGSRTVPRVPQKTVSAPVKSAVPSPNRQVIDEKNPAPKEGSGASKPAASTWRPVVKSAGVSIDTPESKPVPGVSSGDRDFREFVSHTRRTTSQSAKIQRTSLKNQLILAGIVIGMLVALGVIVVIAIQWSARPNPETTNEKTALWEPSEYQSVTAHRNAILPVPSLPDPAESSQVVKS